MIKILHYGISTNMGGIETYLLKIYKKIDKSKIHFDFIDMNVEKPCFYDEFKEMGSKFHKIVPRNKSIIKNFILLRKLFKDEKFDILHCHLNTLSYVLPIYLALEAGCKVIVHSRNSKVSKRLITRILHKINYILLPKKKIKLVAVSGLAGKWLFGKNTKVDIINNGIDIEKFRFNSASRNQIRTELECSNNFIVGHIGVFVDVKNHEYIIKVLEELIKVKTNTILVLIGTGPLKKRINDEVDLKNFSEKVIFLNQQVNIDKYLSAMDFLIFPSKFEGFPNVVLEAQTSGLPCLISDKITSEIILLDSCKQLSVSLSPKVWAQKIIQMSNNKYERKYVAQEIKKLGYSVEEEIEKIEKIYNTLL